MLDRIEGFLRHNTTNEHLNVLSFSDSILIDYGIKNFDLVFINHLEKLDSGLMDQTQCVSLIEQSYRNFLFSIVTEHNLILEDDELPTSELNIILDALKKCQDLENAQYIIDIIRSDDDDVAKLSKILSLACAFSEEWFLIRIAFIHPNTLTLLQEWYETRASIEGLSEESNDAIKTKAAEVNIYLEMLKVSDLNLTKMIRDGMPIGLNFDVYTKALNDYLFILPEKNIAAELYCAAIVSGVDTPRVNLVKSVIGNYTDNSESSTRIQKFVNNLDVKFIQYLKEYTHNDINEVSNQNG